MAKTFEEYLRDAEKAGLLPQAKPAAAAKPADLFGDLDNVTFKSEGSHGDFNLFHTAIDLISRPEFAVTNAIKGWHERDAASADKQSAGQDTSGDAIAGVGEFFADIGKGFFSTDPEEHPYGAQLIQSISDTHNRHNPNYDPDELNDVGKAAGGLALDIALDPLTWLTGGIVKVVQGGARGLKAATTGAKAAEVAGTASAAEKIAVQAADAEKAFDSRIDDIFERGDLKSIADDALDIPVPVGAKVAEVGEGVVRAPDAVPVAHLADDAVRAEVPVPAVKAAEEVPTGVVAPKPTAAEQILGRGTNDLGMPGFAGGVAPTGKPVLGAVKLPSAGDDVAAALKSERVANPPKVNEARRVPTAADTIDDALRVLKGVGQQVKANKNAPKIKEALDEMRTAREHGVLIKTAQAAESDIPFANWVRGNGRLGITDEIGYTRAIGGPDG